MTNRADELSQPDDGSADDGGRRSDAGRVRRKRRNRRILVGVLVTLLVLVLGAAGTAWWFVNRVSSNIERIPNAFDEIPESARPAEAADDSVTFLLGGLDGEDKVDVYEPGAARTDTIMLLHVPDGRDEAYLVSIPRDTYIDVPGHGENKINAAYSLGGPSLFIQTVEQLSGIRIDHLALIDWNGFEALTDALGGVPLTFDEPVQLAGDEGVLPAGDHVLSGEQALQYVRERKGLPGGDFDRVKRQQNYLRALMNEMLSTGTLTSPGTITDVADAVGEAARVDEGLSATDMVQLGLSVRDLRAQNVTFLTVPNNGPGQAGSQSIVVYDAERAGDLWQSMRDGTMPEFLAANPELVTAEDVN
jgi:LCP family protein required for cell wall assembly